MTIRNIEKMHFDLSKYHTKNISLSYSKRVCHQILFAENQIKSFLLKRAEVKAIMRKKNQLRALN